MINGRMKIMIFLTLISYSATHISLFSSFHYAKIREDFGRSTNTFQLQYGKQRQRIIMYTNFTFSQNEEMFERGPISCHRWIQIFTFGSQIAEQFYISTIPCNEMHAISRLRCNQRFSFRSANYVSNGTTICICSFFNPQELVFSLLEFNLVI